MTVANTLIIFVTKDRKSHSVWNKLWNNTLSFPGAYVSMLCPLIIDYYIFIFYILHTSEFVNRYKLRYVPILACTFWSLREKEISVCNVLLMSENHTLYIKYFSQNYALKSVLPNCMPVCLCFSVFYMATCQKCANFSFLFANIPINMPTCRTACQYFDLTC